MPMYVDALTGSRSRRKRAVPRWAGLQRRSFIKLTACAPMAYLLAGCSGLERGTPAPAAVADQITGLGIPNARFWPDTQGAALVAEGEAGPGREPAPPGGTGRVPRLPPT